MTDIPADSIYAFQDTMSEETLRNYLLRSVSALGFCAEGANENLIFDEDLRMVQNIGAKFISRAALFAWTVQNAELVEPHFELARNAAAKVHDMDPEIILCAFVAEIVHRNCVEGTPVPSWVFEDFGQAPESRNFRFDDIITLSKGPDFWMKDAGYPDYSREECQYWYYYCIRRYIDCGYECIHLQESDDDSELPVVDRILDMGRAYARRHARRGLVLYHSFYKQQTGGDRIDGRLLFDIHGNGLVPHRTVFEDGAQKCRICTPQESPYSWFGLSGGGEHPLGFTVEINPTILELDNYGPGQPDFAPWGYDDISWFSVQPEWYRNEFLQYVEDLTSSHYLTQDGKRSYYQLMPMRRCTSAGINSFTTNYLPQSGFDNGFFDRYCASRDENIKRAENPDGSYSLTSCGFYHSNTQSDACPNGFNQEETIRRIFRSR
ncbi:MAG: hypothetical protein ACYC5K_04800 [Saccharofermentanales bacterium]